MSVQGFTVGLTVAAALLAGWFVWRFPRLVPASGRGILAALVVAAAVYATTPVAIHLVGVPLGTIGALLLVALPGCTYFFLVAAWIMLFVRRAIDPRF